MSRARTLGLQFATLLLVAQFAFGQESTPASFDAVLWSDPGEIRSRDLFWGPGGKDHQPSLPVEFLAEDLKGTSPKFEVRDSDGRKWTAKLGLEAKPETVAARLLWAVGYSANENYFVPNLQVRNMPACFVADRTLRVIMVTFQMFACNVILTSTNRLATGIGDTIPSTALANLTDCES